MNSQSIERIRHEVLHAYRNKATVFLYSAAGVSVLFAAGLFSWWGDWASAGATLLIFFLMLIPSVLKERYRLYLPFSLEFSIVIFIFLSLFLGGMAHLYDYIPFWDKFVHFQSGLLLSPSGYVLVYILNEHEKIQLDLSPGFLSLFAVAFSVTLGVGWEIMEFTGDSIFHTAWQFDNTDTMTDLIADAVGALVLSIPAFFWMHRYKRLPFTPWFLRMLREKLGPEVAELEKAVK